MSHVTTPTLAELEARMLRLVKWRAARVEEAERVIAETNCEFDRAAIPLGREIDRLKAEAKSSETARRSKKPSEPHFDGLTNEEIQHYRELKERK